MSEVPKSKVKSSKKKKVSIAPAIQQEEVVIGSVVSRRGQKESDNYFYPEIQQQQMVQKQQIEQDNNIDSSDQEQQVPVQVTRQKSNSRFSGEVNDQMENQMIDVERNNRFIQSGSSFNKRQLSNSQKKPSPYRVQFVTPSVDLMCVHHGEQFSFFCETCEQPICNQCTIQGPHNNQMHRINRMNDAYQAKKNQIQQQIQGNLKIKRDQILAQIHRIEYRIEEIKYVKVIIERDIRIEYEGLLERLRAAEGMKLAVLQHETTELQRDLERINEIGSQFYQLSNDPLEYISFLLNSRYLYENIERVSVKPFKSEINVYPYDLPREITELRLYLSKVAAQQQVLEDKNEIIWKLLNDRKIYEKQVYEELEKQTNEEVNEWSELVDKFQNEINRYQIMCCFCGVALDPKIINSACNSNVGEGEIQVQCTEQPPQNYYGNQRHFFSKPYFE